MHESEQVVSNPLLLTSILNHCSSQELLPPRRVCKLWRDEANRLIRARQRKFFLSPNTKTTSTAGYNDPGWKRSWEDALQISFIYSPWRKSFVRASRRLIETTYLSIHLQTSSLHQEEKQIESAFFQETEDFYHGRERPTPHISYNSPMAGCSLDQLTDFLESSVIKQTSPEPDRKTGDREQKRKDFHDLDGRLGPSNFPHLSFRFECGRLWEGLEISRFFRVMGPYLRYMTVGLNHMCRGPESWDDQWDHSYQVFRQLVPNLEALTLMALDGRWMTNIGEHHPYVDPQDNQPPVKSLPQIGDEGQLGMAFAHLKCLRIQGFPYEHVGSYARWIMIQAPRLEMVVFENGFAPPILLAIGGGVDFESFGTKIIHSSIRLIIPITTLCIRLLAEAPQTIKHMAQLISLQQFRGGLSPVRTLHLDLSSEEEVSCVTGAGRSPYKLPFVPPLLDILKVVANSLETMSLAGGAGTFLEGLLQPNLHGSSEECIKSFPNVCRLFFCLQGTRWLKRQDFVSNTESCLTSTFGSSSSSSSSYSHCSTTTLSKVFPRVYEISLGYFPINFGGNMELESWMSFTSHPDMLFNRPECSESQVQGQLVTEVESIKVLHFSSYFPAKALKLWKFSNVVTLCLQCSNFFTLAPTIWTLASLQHLNIDGIDVNGGDESLAPKLEAALTGLSIEVITQWTQDLERSLATVPQGDLIEYLKNKKAAFKSIVTRPSIFDLCQLRHLKCMVDIVGLELMISREFSNRIFSPVGGLLVFDMPTPSFHATFWTRENGTVEKPPLNQDILEKVFGATVSNNPRVTLRGIRSDTWMPLSPF